MHIVWSGPKRPPEAPLTRRLLALYWDRLKTKRGLFCLATGLMIVQTVLGLVPSLLSRRLFDSGLMAGNYPLFKQTLIIQGFCFALSGALAAGCLLIYTRVGADITAQLARDLYRHLQALPFRYFVETKPAEYLQSISSDIGGLEDAFGPELGQTLVAVLKIAVAVPVMLFWDWKLAAVSIWVLPLIAWAAFTSSQRSKTLLYDQLGSTIEINNTVSQSLGIGGYLANIHSLTKERNANRFDVLTDNLKGANHRRARQSQISSTAAGLLTYLGAFSLNALGGSLVIGKNLSLGTLIAYGAVGAFLSGPASQLARQWVSIGDSLVRLKRIKDVLDMPAESSALSPRRKDLRFRKSLSFNDVGFGYKPGKPTLKNASFSISPGEAIALVGPSGSGKTTTAYLMLRLFEPTSGEILLDGHDVRSLPIQDYRDLFAFVPQDTLLQNATIRENLLLNNPDASQTELEDACRAAHVHDFIIKLPNGYDAAVGQGGHHFSGGERQRLAIARALLSKPAVMIMDEPTSALDAETERLVIRDLRDYLGDETALMLITHRPSVSKEMDRILTANGGRIGDSDQIPAIGFRPRATLSVFPPSLGHC